MIKNNTTESLALLNSFFSNELSRIDIPELIRIDSLYGLWNGLVFTNLNLNSIKLENMEQAPYIINCENLLELKLDKLQEIEFGSATGGGLYFRNISDFPTKFLHNSKLQSLNLPNFKGTQTPLPINTNDTSSASMASFQNNYWLRDVSLGNSLMREEENENYKFNGFWFNNSYFLKFLKLNYPYVIPLVRIAGLSTTPIGNGSGYIYVPDELLASYKSAPQWNIFNQKFKGISEYEQDFNLYKDSITDDWTTILTNCANNTVEKYEIGGTKTVIINNIPTQFRIVGKGVDTLVNPTETSTKAALSWMETTITRFSAPRSVQDVFSPTNPRQFQNATNFRNIINQIYNNIEPTVKNGIKQVIKSGRGYNQAGYFSDYNSEDYLWPPSRLELGLDFNKSPFTYYQTTPRRIINYYLGETNINEIGGKKILVALRDYTGASSSYPDLLRPNSDPEQSMEIVDTDNTNPYIIIGFCT